jgi:hypothetical protein
MKVAKSRLSDCMKRLLALHTGLGGRAGALGCILLAAMSGAVLAQTTGAVNPAAPPAAKEEPPPGGCMPIGLTVSCEVVFPFQCKDFIERQRAANQKPAAAENEKPAAADQKPVAGDDKTDAKPPAAAEKPAIAETKPDAAPANGASAENKPAAAEEKPAMIEEKTAARQQESAAPQNSKPAAEPFEAAPPQRRVENEIRRPAAGPRGCIHFRSYDPVSGTYRTFDGRRAECR